VLWVLVDGFLWCKSRGLILSALAAGQLGLVVQHLSSTEWQHHGLFSVLCSVMRCLLSHCIDHRCHMAAHATLLHPLLLTALLLHKRNEPPREEGGGAYQHTGHQAAEHNR
jgi:hypothetical protein